MSLMAVFISKCCLVLHKLNILCWKMTFYIHVIIPKFNLRLHSIKFYQVVQAVCCLIYWKSFPPLLPFCTYLSSLSSCKEKVSSLQRNIGESITMVHLQIELLWSAYKWNTLFQKFMLQKIWGCGNRIS